MNLIKKMFNKNKKITIVYLIVLLFYLLSLVLFTKNILSLTGIETTIRLIVLILLYLYFLIYVKKTSKKIIKGRFKKANKSILIALIISVCIFCISNILSDLYNVINNIGESDNITFSSKLIKLNDSEFNSDSVVGMIENIDDVEGYLLANVVMVNNDMDNKIVYYNSYIKMLYDLYTGEIDAAFMQNNYISLYNEEEGLENLGIETEVIYFYEATYENSYKVESTNKTFDEPLTFLILGVDSSLDGLDDSAAFNGDTIMIVTINPETLNATMFSIPRDLMVPITCNNNQVAKINSAAAYGTSCMIDTINSLIDIEIDYYVKINFTGVIDLVDALNGIDVDVEAPDINTYDGQICEQNSLREFGDNLVCFDPGYQTLNGYQALAYARNRKLYLKSDIARIEHQQQIVTAIASKALTISSYSVFEGILNAISDNIVTNMTSGQILSAYTVFKSMVASAVGGNQLINIEKSYLEYYDLRVYMTSYGMETAGLGYYQDSLDDIIMSMKINLGHEDETIIKSFSFENGEVYEGKVYGKGYYGDKSYEVLTNFAGSTKEDAEAYCSENEIECEFIIVGSESEFYNNSIGVDLIGNQSIRHNTLMIYVSDIIFYINDEPSEVIYKEDEEDETEEIENIITDFIE